MERTSTIILDAAVTKAILSVAAHASGGDPAAAVEIAFAKALKSIDGTLEGIDARDDLLELRWRSLYSNDRCVDHVLPLLEQGRVMEAALLMELLLAIDQSNSTVMYNLGMVYSDAGFLDRAIDLLQVSLTIDPKNANGYVSLGVAYTRQDSLDAAKDILNRAIEIDPSNPWAYQNLGAVLLRMEKPEEAVRVLTNATELAPDNDRVWYGLAQALELIEETGKADEAYQRVIAINEFGEMADAARDARSRIAKATFQAVPGLRMDAVMYLVSAIEKFETMSNEELQKIGFEIAMLGTKGISINDPDSSYTIATLPGEFSGLNLVCHQYAAFKRFAPTMDIGIDLSKEYDAALELHQARSNGN